MKFRYRFAAARRLLLSLQTLTSLIATLLFGLAATPCDAVVWRNDLTDAEVLALAQQGQFAGVGIIRVGGSIGTGVAIAPGWVLTAQHFVPNNSRPTFEIEGVRYQGTAVARNDTDVALVRLDANQQLPSSVPFISPNPGLPAVNQLIWKVGWGQYGSVSQSSMNMRGPAGQARRAGTNVYNRAASVDGPSLIFNNSQTGVNSTAFEVSTAPGDSGGPGFLQHNNQWYVAGTTNGAAAGIGFFDGDVGAEYDWIVSTTGLTFPTPPGPTSLFWDGRFDLPGVQTGPGSWTTENPNWQAGDYNYTWENDFAPTAVFGTAITDATLVTVNDDITVGGIEFAPTAENNGPFQIRAGTGTLAAADGGATIQSDRFALMAASWVGDQTITKTGQFELIFNSDNSAFEGEIVLQEGVTRFTIGETFGSGGFFADQKTTVADGATLNLRGSGLITNEHFHLFGDGFNGRGAIDVSSGNHQLQEAIALRSDTTIDIQAGSSLSINGLRGRFYAPGATPNNTLTVTGAGTLVLDNVSNIVQLAVVNGVASGIGGINGELVLTSGAELRPGDSALEAAMGQFTTGDLMIGADSFLAIDLDPNANLFDSLLVNGMINGLGTLNVNLLSAPTDGQSFLIVQNDGSDTIGVDFNNGPMVMAEFASQSYRFGIDYAAGTGNDIALSFTAVAVPEPAGTAMVVMVGLATATRLRRRRREASPASA